MEENKFEGKWRAAMEGAEAQPSDSVWSSVESTLIGAENVAMRARVIFYQRLAAASLLFALMVGAAGFYFGRNNIEQKEYAAAQNQSPKFGQVTPENNLKAENKRLPDGNKRSNEAVVALSDKAEEKQTMGSAIKNTKRPKSINSTASDSVQKEMDNYHGNEVAETKDIPLQAAQNMKESIALQAESPIKKKKQEEESIVLPGINNVSDEPEVIKKYPHRNSEDVWASVSFAAGNYNPGSTTLNPQPNYSQIQSLTNNANYQVPSANRPSSGTAYSVGFVLGKRISDRWVIQGGVNYLNQNSGSVSVLTASSSNNSQQALDLYNLSAKPASSVTFTSPYQINSALEFISVPVQAGYLLVNRKVGFQMNGGIAADFFVRNSLADPSGQVNSYSQGAGTDSPYRTLNWAGLVSSELSYRLGRQYRVSLVPGVRYLFNSSLKSGATSNSYMADIGFRFRYILR